MTTPDHAARIAEIRERWKKVAPVEFVDDHRTSGEMDCPLCGEGRVDCVGLDLVAKGAGVQVFGVGGDLVDMRAAIAHAPTDVQYLLDRVAELEHKLDDTPLTPELLDQILGPRALDSGVWVRDDWVVPLRDGTADLWNRDRYDRYRCRTLGDLKTAMRLAGIQPTNTEPT